jgi:UrcA family protein
MNSIANRVAGLATLALAALPVAALSTAAHAAPSVPVYVGDLNMHTAAGAATYHQRVATAANRICDSQKGLTLNQVCKASVRAEAHDRLAAAQSATRLASR